MKEHHLSIRDLVPYPDLSFTTSFDPSKSHSAVQAYLRRKYKSFRSELKLSVMIPVDNDLYRISGRIDGFRKVKAGYCIYEIKPVPGNPKEWLKHSELIRARWQLMLYADLFQIAESPYQGNLTQAILILVGDDGRLCEESIDFSSSVEAIKRRILAVRKSRLDVSTRNQALTSLESIVERDVLTDRPLQASVETILDANPLADRILLTLPPGAGKTRVALRFALRAAKRQNQQVYWLTAKATGRLAVQEEIERLNESGLPVTSSWKTTSDRLCSCGFPEESCPIKQQTQTALFFGENLQEDPNRSEQWCPHQIQQNCRNKVHVVIADINYLLNSSSLLIRPAVLIIDEVQHFVNRFIENSRIAISLYLLKRLLHHLPASKRHRFHELISPEWIDEELSSSSLHLWSEFSEALKLYAAEEESAECIHRFSYFLRTYPEDYLVTWYKTTNDSGWIGTSTNIESLVSGTLQNFPVVAALSGSLPADPDALLLLLPGFRDFMRISPVADPNPIIAITPLLDFRFPISQADISDSVAILLKLQDAHKGAIAVFTQNRESSFIISEALRVRGFATMLDTDIDSDWCCLRSLEPDFVLIPLGSSLSESVNPPVNSFSCVAVLAPGHAPQDKLTVHSLSNSSAESFYLQSVRESVSRIIQAVGRVHRTPESKTPVYLLNQAFCRPEFRDLWPGFWFHSMDDTNFESLESAINFTQQALSESASSH